MKYLDQDFKSDSLFDVIRFISSSLFLAPIRLINEITKKIPYVKKEKLNKVCLLSIVINIIIIVYNLALQIYNNKLGLLSGSFPLITPIGSLIVLVYIYVKVTSITDYNVELNENTEEGNEEENIDDYGISKTIERPDVSLSDDDLILEEPVEENKENIKVNLTKPQHSFSDIGGEFNYDNDEVDDFEDITDSLLGTNSYNDVSNIDSAINNEIINKMEELRKEDKYNLHDANIGEEDVATSIEDMDERFAEEIGEAFSELNLEGYDEEL